MKRKEYEAKLKSLQEQIEELKKVKIEEEETDNVYMPEIGTNYFIIDDMGLVKERSHCNAGLSAICSRGYGNIFKTEEEAVKEATYRRYIQKYNAYVRANEKNCIKRKKLAMLVPVYNKDTDEIDIDFVLRANGGLLSATTQDIIKKAIIYATNKQDYNEALEDFKEVVFAYYRG